MARPSVDRPADWVRLFAGLVAAYLLFHGAATALGSDRGQAGVTVATLVVGATLTIERLLFGKPFALAARTVGLGLPAARGVLVATVVGVALAAVIPVFAVLTNADVAPFPGWAALLPGLFAQAGIAEEVLFRGYLFGHIRRGRRFWRAVALATLPFVAVHLVILGTMPWPVALAAVALSSIIALPLCYLFELGGNTIWAPAIVHFVAQGAIKVVESGPSTTLMPLVWMGACALLPFLVFLVPRPLARGSAALQVSAQA